MNTKEIGEIRRRVRRDRSNMTALYGCFVNDNREIISTFRQSLGTMPENEAEQFFKVLKKCLSGTQGKNLIDINFRTQQVANGAEHKLLMKLRETQLKDEDALNEFYKNIVNSVSMNSSYLILIGCDDYDVPFKCKDDDSQTDASNEVYRYLLCAICPVKLSKPTIEYKAPEKEFHNSEIAQILTTPTLGFLFPAFDDRSANIYDALFYSKSAGDDHEDFIRAVFNTQPYVPADAQKQTFANVLSRALDEECSMEVVQAVHDDMHNRIMLHKESKIPEPLVLSKDDIKSALCSAGVSDEKISQFATDYDAAFGTDAQLPAKNIASEKRIEVTTSDAVIRVNADRSDLIETRTIGGVKYIMIAADEDVEVNGVRISID